MRLRCPSPSPLFCALWLTFAASAGTAHATVVDRPGLDALLMQSGLVFEAEVLAVDTGHGVSDGPATRVSVRVRDVLLGKLQANASFWFELPEGRLPDGRFVLLAGAPRFAPGHRYLVFYRSGPWHHTPVVGWSHGVLRRAEIGRTAVWVDAHGRCIAGLEKAGWQLGPRVAGAAPVPEGWIGGAPEAGADGDSPPDAATRCLPVDEVRRALTRRAFELGIRHRDIERQPARGGWIEAGEAP